MNKRIKMKNGLIIKRHYRYKMHIKGEWVNYHSVINKSLLWTGRRSRINYNYCHVAKPEINGFLVGKGWYEYGCKLEQLQEPTKSKDRRKFRRKIIKSFSTKVNPMYFDDFDIFEKGE